ncbi:MAG TPA: GTPase [Acidimicrobiia bacterium]
MHDQLVDVLDRLEATLALSKDHVPPAALDPTAIAARRIRNRLDYPLDLAVVAIAGGTGSGKSSLFNAVLGGDRAEVGGLRPTTSKALASLPAGRRREISGHIESFGDLEMATHDELPWLVLIDLPDTDSVEVDHRLMVENLLPRVDAVIWVVDVEKYRDRSLHHSFLRPLRTYESQFVFVVNQIDRVPQDEVGALVADFREALVEDGFRAPTIHAVAAAPVLISPRGVDELVDALGVRADGLAVDRLLADLDVAIDDLHSLLGVRTADFETEWTAALDDAISLATAGEVVAGSRVLAAFFLGIAEPQSGDGAEELISVAAHAGEILAQANRDALAEFPPQVSKRERRRLGRSSGVDTAGTERQAWLRNRVDGLTADRVRPFLHDRGIARANLAGFAIEVTALRHQSQ